MEQTVKKQPLPIPIPIHIPIHIPIPINNYGCNNKLHFHL
jgi:hypothetical protein